MPALELPTLELPVVSREFLYVTGIQAFDALSPDHTADPTGLPVQIALTAPNTEPAEDDWKDAHWVNPTTARILTGSEGDIEPEAGRYSIWLRITGAVEQPERLIGYLEVD